MKHRATFTEHRGAEMADHGAIGPEFTRDETIREPIECNGGIIGDSGEIKGVARRMTCSAFIHFTEVGVASGFVRAFPRGRRHNRIATQP